MLCPLSFGDKHQQPSWAISPCGLHVFVPEPWCVFWGWNRHNLHHRRPCRSLCTQVYIQLKRPLMLNVFAHFPSNHVSFTPLQHHVGAHTSATDQRSSFLLTSHLNTCFFFIKIDALSSEKLKKMLKNSVNVKDNKKEILISGLHQKLTGSFLGWDSYSIQVLWKSLQEFLWNSADKPTNQQINRHGWRQNLPGGAKNRPFSCANTFRYYTTDLNLTLQCTKSSQKNIDIRTSGINKSHTVIHVCGITSGVILLLLAQTRGAKSNRCHHLGARNLL